MSTRLLPSFRRQQLVLDFSSLRDECPEGIYLSLTPGNPSLWGGAFFVRNGPYAEAILRFQISFSNTYPTTPPLVTFSTDVFHPLVVPLTTYTFSAHGDAAGTVSVSEEYRLPPGAFSLRYGFPAWFVRERNVSSNSTMPEEDREERPEQTQEGLKSDRVADVVSDLAETAPSQSPKVPRDPPLSRKTTLLNLIQHIYSSFTDDSLLDALPLSAAGNPSAWHAWRAHRGLTHHTKAAKASNASVTETGSTTSSTTSPSSPKHPGDWKWDGVWESRVESAVRDSITEGTLFGSSNVNPGLGLGEAPGSGLGFRGGAGGDAGRGGTGVGGASNLDARQKLQALADKQIRFTKMSDDAHQDVRTKVGTLLGVADLAGSR